jgi:SAM-dependent methyltransferase
MTNSSDSPSQNPFKDYGLLKADEDRYKLTLKKLPPHLSGTVLDLGVENPFTAILKATYPKLEITNTPAETDLDVDGLPFSDRTFDIVFSFEVLEHLMNPLWNLMECRRVLKDRGTIYVTTPKGIFPSTIMWPDTHFHEIDYKRIHILAERADLWIKRFEHFNKGPFYWWKMGIIRPTLRILLGGWFYIEMEKKAAR